MKKLVIAIAAIALMGQGCLPAGRITTQPPIAKPQPAPSPTPAPSPMPYNY